MNELDVAVGQTWHPLAWLGFTHPFFSIGPEEAHVIVQTWIILGIIFLLCLPVRWLLKNRFGIPRYLILSFVDSMIGLCKQSMGYSHIPSSRLCYINFFIYFVLQHHFNSSLDGRTDSEP